MVAKACTDLGPALDGVLGWALRHGRPGRGHILHAALWGSEAVSGWFGLPISGHEGVKLN